MTYLQALGFILETGSVLKQKGDALQPRARARLQICLWG